MFSVGERDELRERLIAAARADAQITAAAVVGSGARDAEDEWSDIDLALRLEDRLEPRRVADVWTTRMYDQAGVVDHLDVWSGATLFRVFLLSSSLQVDLSFWPSATFASSGGPFRLLFGESNEPRPLPAPTLGDPVGLGWLYALHVRSSLARGRASQALAMVDGLRDQVVALACRRHCPPPHRGRGVEDLPPELRQRIAETVVQGLDETELRRAFAASVALLLDEAQRADPAREKRLRGVARQLVHPCA